MVLMSGYELYCEWCRERNRTPPTQEWWDWACAYAAPVLSEAEREQLEVEREWREGWAP